MTTFKNLEQHIRDTKHTDNMREFMRTLPQEMQDKPKVVKNTEEDNNSMYWCIWIIANSFIDE